MKNLIKKFIRLFFKIPLPIKLIKFIEEICLNYQGIGIRYRLSTKVDDFKLNGYDLFLNKSVKNEINSCISLMKK